MKCKRWEHLREMTRKSLTTWGIIQAGDYDFLGDMGGAGTVPNVSRKVGPIVLRGGLPGMRGTVGESNGGGRAFIKSAAGLRKKWGNIRRSGGENPS